MSQQELETWKGLREAVKHYKLELGPAFAMQALDQPRHLLFTLARYKFVAKMLPQDAQVDVLELGCSEGIGSLMLAERGHRITAVDFDADAIAHAKKTIHKPNINFVSDDFLGKSYGKFRAITSLDVIEHIDKSKEDAYFKTICQNLDDEGFAMVGTPNDCASQYASKASQIGHINMYTAERLTTTMRKYFKNVFMFSMNDEVLHTGFYPMSHYLMALGCNKR